MSGYVWPRWLWGARVSAGEAAATGTAAASNARVFRSVLRVSVLRISVLRISVLRISVLRISVLRVSVLLISVLRTALDQTHRQMYMGDLLRVPSALISCTRRRASATACHVFLGPTDFQVAEGHPVLSPHDCKPPLYCR